ncbi:MAG: TolC family protein [Burkholderiaceae bacterium]
MPNRTVGIIRLSRLVLGLALVWSGAAYADDLSLSEAIASARLHDKEYLSASTLTDSANALRAQAGSLWRPQVVLSASAGKASNETKTAGAQFSAPSMGMFNQTADFNTSISNGTMTQWAVSAKQPLYNPARRAQSQQLKLGAQITDLQRQGAEQALIVRTAERYFDAQLAQQKLQLLSAQLKSTQSSTEEAQYRFDIGNRPITEVYESQAQLAEIQAAHYGAQSDLQIKLQRLQDAIGHIPAALPNAVQLRQPLPKLEPLAVWQTKAQQNNIELQMQALAVRNAQTKAQEYALGASASVDLVGQIGRQKLSGDGDYGSAKNQQNNSMIGVQLTVPLYTGGYNSAKYQEAQAALKKAQIDLQRTQEQVAQNVNAAWLGAQTAQLQVSALSAALKASAARLDATKTGQEVGHRTVLDVLNAQNQNTQVRINLESAKQQYVMSRLRLGALVQALDEGMIRQWVADKP